MCVQVHILKGGGGDPWFSSELVMQNSNCGDPTNITEELMEIFVFCLLPKT